jgi:hypothetical protein
MAETITNITRPPEFIESEAKLYLDQLQNAIGGLKDKDLSTVMGPDFVAGLSDLQKLAIQKSGGLGSYEPYLQTAGAQAAEAAKQAGLAGQYMGPDAYKQFMSPYQQDVIGTTLSEYDIQAQKGAQGVPAAAIAAGAFGGGREGVQRAEYGAASDRNRAALQANLLQQGYTQAQQLAGQAFGQQQALSGQQQALANQQMQLAGLAPQLAGQQIAGLTTLGGMEQAQNQAQLQAEQQLAYSSLYQPLNIAQQYGSGVMGLISGYPGQSVTQTAPSPSGLQTLLGAGSTLAGIYGAFNPRPLFGNS